MMVAACPLTFRHVVSVIDFLPPHEAFARAGTSKTWQMATAALDVREIVLRLRSSGWAAEAAEAKCLQDPAFCKRLLRDWYDCLHHSTLQVAYVSYHQHLVFLDPSADLAPPPQGSDPFPVATDSAQYRLLIERFSLSQLWWTCLEQELFHWPVKDKDVAAGAQPAKGYGKGTPGPEEAEATEDGQPAKGYGKGTPGPEEAEATEAPIASSEDLPRQLEAVPGYQGSCAPPKLPEDILAVLSVNTGWFSDSFWTRKLQAILLLRDGRYLLVGTSEMQGSIHSQADILACRCFVADSLAAIVTFAQDDSSREILQTRIPATQEKDKTKMPRLSGSGQHLKKQRVGGEVKQEDVFGPFLKAATVAAASTQKPLFFNMAFDQLQARQAVKAGSRCRVKRAQQTFSFQSCEAKGWGLPDGPLSPAAEQECVMRAHSCDRRFLRYSGGCHLGMRDGGIYSAEVQFVDHAAGTVDVLYTDPMAWPVGDSGFTGSRGSTGVGLPNLQEADVCIERLTLLPNDEWYSKFQEAWDRCGAFSSVSLQFEDSDKEEEGGTAQGQAAEPKEPKEESVPENEVKCSFLELADLFRDTRHAHLHRCQLLSEGSAHLTEEAEQLKTLVSGLRFQDEGAPPGKIWPPESQMQLGKSLMLKLLRKEEFWKTWVAQGGESAAFIATLFDRQKLVQLMQVPPAQAPSPSASSATSSPKTSSPAT